MSAHLDNQRIFKCTENKSVIMRDNNMALMCISATLEHAETGSINLAIIFENELLEIVSIYMPYP